MTIVLTGDVHQYFGSYEQQLGQASEAAHAVTYAQIAAEFGLKVTLFCTGRAVIENREDAQPLLDMPNVELGGHGWDSLQPINWHRFLKLISGSPHGPGWWQRRMIAKTCATISAFSGQPVRSWRNHAYRHDARTPALLAEAGIRVWSDKVELGNPHPRMHAGGVIVLPLNTWPDHDTMYHADHMPEKPAKWRQVPSYPPAEWCAGVRAQVERMVAAGGVATILAHPLCMKTADDWVSWRRLCLLLADYPSNFAGLVG
jgi:hypothetical protein